MNVVIAYVSKMQPNATLKSFHIDVMLNAICCSVKQLPTHVSIHGGKCCTLAACSYLAYDAIIFEVAPNDTILYLFKHLQ